VDFGNEKGSFRITEREMRNGVNFIIVIGEKGGVVYGKG